MLLKQCYISNFGKLQDFTYDFKEGLNVICEENGWGKSTFAAFIRAMLYGMPTAGSRTKLEEAERRKFKPWQGGTLGGYLIFEVNGKTYKAERTFGTKEAEDTFRLIDLSTNLESTDFSAELGKELFGLDKEAYSRSTYLPQNRISDGGMNDSIGKKLGRTLEGDEESGNFDKAYGELDELRKKYIPDRQKDEKGYVAELNRRISETESRLENCQRKEENAKPWREKERAAAEEKKKCNEVLLHCRERMEAAAGYEAVLAKKRHYGELCMREEKLKQQAEGIESLLPAGVPEEEELRQCRSATEEAAALSGELRSYRLSEEEEYNLKRLEQVFADGVPEAEELQEDIRKEREREEKIEEAEDLYRQAEALEQAKGKAGKRFLLGGVLLFVLAVVLLVGAIVSGNGEKDADAPAAPEIGTELVVATEKSAFEPSLLFGICAGLAVAGSVCLMAAGLGKQKKAKQEGKKKEQYLSVIAYNKEQEREMRSRYAIGEETDVTAELYRMMERAGEYRRLSEKSEKYRVVAERKETLLVNSRELLCRYRMETEEVSASLYLLEQRRRDFIRCAEELAEATKKREQFEQENPPESFLTPTQSTESLAQLQQKEREIVGRIALLEDEEKDCRNRAEDYEKEAEDYGELVELLAELKEELAAKKREHSLVTETMKCLKTAKEQFSSRYMRGLKKSFQEYVLLLGGDGLEKSTGGRFGGVETDVNLQVQVSAYGKGMELGYFSTGMRDLIGLCMRFALVDALYEDEEPFLILDDPFVNFDEEKLQKALNFLRKTGEKYQILYLICHGSRS